MKKIFRFIMLIVASVVIGFAVLLLLADVGNKEDKMRCFKYQDYSKQFPDFWITAQEKVDCDNFGITIDAEVK